MGDNAKAPEAIPIVVTQIMIADIFPFARALSSMMSMQSLRVHSPRILCVVRTNVLFARGTGTTPELLPKWSRETAAERSDLEFRRSTLGDGLIKKEFNKVSAFGYDVEGLPNTRDFIAKAAEAVTKTALQRRT